MKIGIDGAGSRQALLTISDGAVSSATNFGFQIVAAVLLTSQEFGAISVAFTTISVLMGLSRAVTSEILLAHGNATLPGQSDTESAGLGLAISIGLTGGLVIGGAGVVADLFGSEALTSALYGAAIAAPVVLAQDYLRYIAFSRLRPRTALVSDLAWGILLSSVLLAMGLGVLGAPVMGLIAAWGLSAFGGLFIAQYATGLRPKFNVRGWLRVYSGQLRSYISDFAVRRVAPQVVNYVLAGAAGLAAFGSFRYAQVLMGPTLVVNSAAMAFVSPKVRQLSASKRRTAGRGVAGAMATGSLVWVLVVWAGLSVGLVPTGNISEAVLKSVVPLVGLHAIAISFGVPLVAYLRVDGRHSFVSRWRAVGGITAAALGSLGAGWYGVYGAAIGLAVGNWMAAVGWFIGGGEPKAEKSGGSRGLYEYE